MTSAYREALTLAQKDAATSAHNAAASSTSGCTSVRSRRSAFRRPIAYGARRRSCHFVSSPPPAALKSPPCASPTSTWALPSRPRTESIREPRHRLGRNGDRARHAPARASALRPHAVFDPLELDLDAGLAGGTITHREVMEREFALMTAPLDDVVAFVVKHARVRPGFAQFARRFDPLIISSGFFETIEPVLAREGVAARLRANHVDARADGWRIRWVSDSECTTCGQPCKRGSLPDGKFAYVGRRILRPLRRARGGPHLRARRPRALSRRRGCAIRAVHGLSRPRPRRGNRSLTMVPTALMLERADWAADAGCGGGSARLGAGVDTTAS